MKRLFVPLTTAILFVALSLLSPAARAQDEEGGEAISIENRHVLLMVKAKIAPEVIIEKNPHLPLQFRHFPACAGRNEVEGRA